MDAQGSARSLSALASTRGDPRAQGVAPCAAKKLKRVPSLVPADPVTTATTFIRVTLSVDPLREEVAGRQFRRHVGRRHRRVLTEVLGALPLEELDAVLRVRLAAEVAISGGLLVLGLAEGERLGNGAGP